MDTPDARFRDTLPHLVQPVVPAGRADDETEAVPRRDCQRMLERRGLREVDQDLRAVQRLFPVDVEDADDLVPALARHALDRLPHLAVAVNSDFHNAHTVTGCSKSAAWTCCT